MMGKYGSENSINVLTISWDFIDWHRSIVAYRMHILTGINEADGLNAVCDSIINDFN